MSTVTFTTPSVTTRRAARHAEARPRARDSALPREGLRALRAFASAAFEVVLLGAHDQEEAGVRPRYVHVAQGGRLRAEDHRT